MKIFFYKIKIILKRLRRVKMWEYVENMFIEVDTKLFLEREAECFKKGRKSVIKLKLQKS